MRSDLMKRGLERAPHRSLYKAMGYTDEEIAQPLIGVAIPTTRSFRACSPERDREGGKGRIAYAGGRRWNSASSASATVSPCTSRHEVFRLPAAS